MSKAKLILLSFDTEEFDLPREQGVDIEFERSIEISTIGTNLILDTLKQNQVKATFFCTANFAMHAPDVMQRILDEGHEVACHGVDHFNPKDSDLKQSKEIIERLTQTTVNGYRQPRMFAPDDEELERIGYLYDSSLHPTFIPGRYMHLDMPRTPFYKGKVLQIPSSVTPCLRLPVFWLAYHNYPKWLYKKLMLWTLRHDGQFVIYFHPWEYYPLKEHPEWKIPYIIKRNSGAGAVKRLDSLIKTFKQQGARFVTYTEFTQHFNETAQSSTVKCP